MICRIIFFSPCIFRIAISIWLAVLISFNATSQSYRSEAEIKKSPADIVEFYLIAPGHLQNVYGEKEKGFTEFEFRKNYLKARPNVKIVADKKNAFLSISDNSTELGYEMQMTYFIKADGKKILAVADVQAGGDCDSRSLTFYQFENEHFVDVTSEIFPSLKLKDFCPKALDDKLSLFELDCQLPQYGTTIKVSAHALCEQDERLRGISQDYYPYFQRLKCQSLELVWNKAQGKFLKK